MISALGNIELLVAMFMMAISVVGFQPWGYKIAIYIVEQMILQTIYVINKDILQFLGLKSMIDNQERFQIKSGL